MLGKKGLTVLDKAGQISEDWGIPFETVREIQKKNLNDCTWDELKIRYNDPNLGVLPEWFSYEEVNKIVWNTVHSTWNAKDMDRMLDKEDICSDCWVKIYMVTKEINQVGERDYLKYLKKVISWHISNKYFYSKIHRRYIEDRADVNIMTSEESGVGFTYSTEEIDTTSDKEIKEYASSNTKLGIASKDARMIAAKEIANTPYKMSKDVIEDVENKIQYENIEIVSIVDGIKNVELRRLLILIGYLVADISDLIYLFEDEVGNLTDTQRTKLSIKLDTNNVHIIISDKELKSGKDNKITPDYIAKVLFGTKSAEYIEALKSYIPYLLNDRTNYGVC